MDSSQCPLEIGVVQPTETSRPVLERKARPQNDRALNCPRCNSTNTKFCYYNNYSLSQPRYMCKTCKRYWTQGGTIRNVPVGGGSRKNKKPLSKKLDLTPPSFPKQSPNTHEVQDINIVCNLPIDHQDQSCNSMPKFFQVPFSITDNNRNIQLQDHSVPSQNFSAIELMKTVGTTNITTTATTTPSFVAMQGLDQHTLYSSEFPVQEFKHGLNYCLEEYGGGCDNILQETNGTGRRIFAVEELNEVPSMKGYERYKGQGDSNGV